MGSSKAITVKAATENLDARHVDLIHQDGGTIVWCEVL
jgi:hypothetical protein